MTRLSEDGGRLIIDIQNIHNKLVKLLRIYFYIRSQSLEFHTIVCDAGYKYTSLNLCDVIHQENETLYTTEKN